MASELIGDGTSIDTDPPHYPTWDRARLAYAADQLWRTYWPLLTLAALSAVALLTTLVVRRRRRS